MHDLVPSRERLRSVAKGLAHQKIQFVLNFRALVKELYDSGVGGLVRLGMVLFVNPFDFADDEIHLADQVFILHWPNSCCLTVISKRLKNNPNCRKTDR